MKINDILVLDESQLDEYGNAPNDSTDPRVAGGVPNAVGNLKARRLARNAPAKPAQDTQAPGADQQANTTQTNPTNTQSNGQAGTTGQTGGTPGSTAQTGGTPGTPGTKGNPFAQGFFGGLGWDRTAKAFAGTPGTPGTPGATAQTGGTTGAGTTAQTGAGKEQPAAGQPSAQDATAGQGQQQQAGSQQAAVDANKDPQYKIFKDPAAFKAEWDKYVTAHTKPDSPYQLISDPEMLTALKDMWMRSGGLKVESKQSKKAQRLIEQRIMKDPIYESFSRIGRMITEAELTQDQIKQIFQSVADGAAAGGNVQNAGDEPVSNRTLVGKGGDVAKKVAQAWDDVKTKISQSAPVAGFDQAVDSIQGKLLNAAGGESGAVGQALAKYREFGKQHPIFQGAIYAGLIALAGISGAGLGGAALLAGIKTFDRLLQGDKASSALWKGFKTGALAYGASHLLNQPQTTQTTTTTDTGQVNIGPVNPDLNNAIDNGVVTPPGVDATTIDPTNPDAWIDGTQANGTDLIPYTVQQGETLSQIAQSNGISVKDIMDNNPMITNPNNLPTGIELHLPQNVENYNVYDQGVGTAADTAAKVGTGQYAPTWGNTGTKPTVNSSYIPVGTMISEYVDYEATMRMRLLAESRGMSQKGCYLTASGVKAIFEGVVAEGPWDAIKSGVGKVAGGVEKFGQGIANAAKKGWDSAANKITYDKLDLNWRKNYKEFDPTGGQGPVDSEQVKAFLRKQGVTDVLINKVFGDLGLDAPAQSAQPAQEPAQPQGFGGGAEFTALFKKFNDAGGNLAPQVRGVLKDILLTAMRTVESIQRQRMYKPPVLSEVKTDFSAALLKSLR